MITGKHQQPRSERSQHTGVHALRAHERQRSDPLRVSGGKALPVARVPGRNVHPLNAEMAQHGEDARRGGK
jgi:hypothetical protein